MEIDRMIERLCNRSEGYDEEKMVMCDDQLCVDDHRRVFV